MISKKALLSLSLGALLLGGTITASASTNKEEVNSVECVKALKVKMHKLKEAQSKEIVDFKNIEAVETLDLKDIKPMKIIDLKDSVKAEVIQSVKVEGLVELPSGDIIKIENVEKLIEKLNLENGMELDKVKSLLESGEVKFDEEVQKELESDGIIKKIAVKKVKAMKVVESIKLLDGESKL